MAMSMGFETILSSAVEDAATVNMTSLFLYIGAILLSALLLWLVRPESEDNYMNGKKLVSVLKGSPFFGNALDFLPENILHTLYTYPSRYGDHIIFYAMFQKCYSIADPVTAKEIFVKRPKVFCRQLIMEYAADRIGVLQSVFMARGMVWSQQRRNISPAFNHKNVREYENDIHHIIREWIQSLSNNYSKDSSKSYLSVDMLREPFRMTVSVVNRVVFGISFKGNSTQDEASEAYFNSPQLVDDLLSQFKYIMDSIFYPFPFWTIPYYSPLHKIEQAAIDAAERFKAAVLPIIQHKRELALQHPKLGVDKEGRISGENNSLFYKPSMIDHLIVRNSLSVATSSAVKEDEKEIDLVDNDDILANVRIIYFGGIDTTAVAISWMCFHLAIFPHWVILLRHEIESVVFHHQKVKAEATASISQMWFEILSNINFNTVESQLPFCQAFIKENMRCKGPVSGLIHNLESNVPSFTCSNGLKIEASKGFININLEGIHHHPEYYEDPWLFRPERWIDATSSAATWLIQQQQMPVPEEEEAKNIPKKNNIPYNNTIASTISAEHCSSSVVLQRMEEAFLPFGYGPRICPGNKMSLVEQLITLVYLVMMFDLHLECDKREIRRLCSVTSPPNKMPILLHSRK